MKKKKLLRSAFMKAVSMVILSTVVLSAAGCNNNVDSDNTNGSNDENGITITWFNHLDEGGKNIWMNYCVDKLHEIHPDITVRTETVGYDTYVSMLKTKFAGNDIPDVFDLSDRADICEFAKNGYCMDLSNCDFISNIVAAGTDNSSYDGKIYGAYPEVTLKGVTYNKTVFDQVGIKEIPKTLDELYKDCEILKKAGIASFGLGYKDGWPIWASYDLDSIPSMYMKDPELDVKRIAGEKPFMQDDAFRNVIKRMYERYQYAQDDPFGTNQETVRNLMAQGKVAMIPGGSWEISDVQSKAPDSEIGFFAIPRSNDPEDTILTVQGQGGYMVAENGQKEAALELMKVMFSEESIQFYQDEVGAIGTFKDMAVDESKPGIAYANRLLTEGKFFSNFNIDVSLPSQFGDYQRDQMSAFLMNPTMDIDTICENYDKQLASIVADS